MKILDKLNQRLQNSFPNGQVQLSSEDDVHFKLIVIDASFKGLSKIEQHRKVYEAVGDMMAEECHALQIETYEESL